MPNPILSPQKSQTLMYGISKNKFATTPCFLIEHSIFFPPEILANADLSKTSSRQIRSSLETKFDCSLISRKAEIDKIVMDYVDQQNGSEEEESSDDDAPAPAPPTKSKKQKRAAKGSDSDADSDDNHRTSKRTRTQEKPKPKKRAKKEAGSGGGGGGSGKGYTKPLQLSPELADVVGAECLPRHEVVKRIWAIIKERSLYDPKNKQFAICDGQLQKVMGVKRFRTFGMMKYLKTHFRDS